MGFLTDLFKEIPLSSVLKEKITAIEDENAALKTENAILKDDNHKLQAENKRLKDEIKSLTHKDDLEEIEIKILVRLGDERRDNYSQFLKGDLQLDQIRLEYYLHALTEKKYIYYYGLYLSSDPGQYLLTQKGKEYLIKNNLI